MNRPTLIGLMTSNILSEFLDWNIDFSSLILKHSLIAISNVVEKSFSSKGIWYLTRWISGKRENGKRHSFTFIDEISSDSWLLFDKNVSDSFPLIEICIL